uniref:Metalloendopeptidase n=1 Tax=Panagrellus redivivus TaxID=6233 RepID=A0A7E4VSS6_PANRE
MALGTLLLKNAVTTDGIITSCPIGSQLSIPPESGAKIIQSSLKKIEEISCFRFPQRTKETDFLDIDKRDGCYSYVGRVGGRQLLSLSEGCVYSFIIIHEVMHVLGLEHEHQRPDRDQFIKILYKNVEEDKMANFGLISANDVDYKEHPYDYLSIMHYDGTAFGKTDRRTGEKLVTMVPLKAGVELHDNYELTKLDIEKLNSLGKCKGHASERTQGTLCNDVASNCADFVEKNLCKNAIYKELMMERCALACGFCSTEGTAAVNPVKAGCHDTIAECPTFAKNGFCDNKFYDHKLCAQSCGLCKA